MELLSFRTSMYSLVLLSIVLLSLESVAASHIAAIEYSTSPKNPNIIFIEANTADGKVKLPWIYGKTNTYLGSGQGGKKLWVSSPADISGGTTSNLLYNLSNGDRWFPVSTFTLEGSDDDQYIKGKESHILSAKLDGKKVILRNEVTKKNICAKMKVGDTCTIGDATIALLEINKDPKNNYIILQAWSNSDTTARFNFIFGKYSKNGDICEPDSPEYVYIMPQRFSESEVQLVTYIDLGDDGRFYKAYWEKKRVRLEHV